MVSKDSFNKEDVIQKDGAAQARAGRNPTRHRSAGRADGFSRSKKYIVAAWLGLISCSGAEAPTSQTVDAEGGQLWRALESLKSMPSMWMWSLGSPIQWGRGGSARPQPYFSFQSSPLTDHEEHCHSLRDHALLSMFQPGGYRIRPHSGWSSYSTILMPWDGKRPSPTRCYTSHRYTSTNTSNASFSKPTEHRALWTARRLRRSPSPSSAHRLRLPEPALRPHPSPPRPLHPSGSFLRRRPRPR